MSVGELGDEAMIGKPFGQYVPCATCGKPAEWRHNTDDKCTECFTLVIYDNMKSVFGVAPYAAVQAVLDSLRSK